MNSKLRTKEIILEEKERKKNFKSNILKTEISLPELKKLRSFLKEKKEELSYYKNIFKEKAIFRKRSKPLNKVINLRYTK